jgi:hypothetical protein
VGVSGRRLLEPASWVALESNFAKPWRICQEQAIYAASRISPVAEIVQCGEPIPFGKSTTFASRRSLFVARCPFLALSRRPVSVGEGGGAVVESSRPTSAVRCSRDRCAYRMTIRSPRWPNNSATDRSEAPCMISHEANVWRLCRARHKRHHADSRIMPTGLRHEAGLGGDRGFPTRAVGIIRGVRETRGVDRVVGSGLASRRSVSCAPAPAL